MVTIMKWKAVRSGLSKRFRLYGIPTNTSLSRKFHKKVTEILDEKCHDYNQVCGKIVVSPSDPHGATKLASNLARDGKIVMPIESIDAVAIFEIIECLRLRVTI